MVDPRIYRASWALVAVALILFGFSLRAEPGGRSSSAVVGDFFSGSVATMQKLAQQYPDRKAGSGGDARLADWVAGQEQATGGFDVQQRAASVHTASGLRTLINVVATRPGVSASQVVVISQRDSSVPGNVAGLSGTAVMVELARALSGQTLTRGVTLISTSGQIGAAGATALARQLTGQPVEAVIVLGDLAGATIRQPVVVPFSSTKLVAPVALTKTVATYVSLNAGIANRMPAFGGQLLRLAFPFAVTGQAPFVSRSIPAVLLSLSGERPTSGSVGEINPTITSELGAAVASSVEALDTGSSMASPSSELTLSGHLVPSWALRILVLALLAPVILATLDAVARAARHGHSLRRWLAWVLAGALPFVVGYAGLLLARVTGLLGVVTAGAVGPGEVPLTGRGIATMAGAGVLILISFLLLRPVFMREIAGEATEREPESPAANAAAVALSVVTCVTALVIWFVNPFSAVLVIPAAHLWLWLAEPGVRRHRCVTAVGLLLSVTPMIIVLLYYRGLYGFTLSGMLWSGTLMIAGRSLSLVPALYWSLMCGCAFAAVVLAIKGRPRSIDPEAPEITVRGPLGYAGPGSLGGTESALRR